MNVLVAGEFSGIVRDAFRAKGHDAWSCDLLPATVGDSGLGHIYHLQGDVRWVLNGAIPKGMVATSTYRPIPIYRRWDMILAFLPCTYFCNSGVRWYTTIPKQQKPGVLYGAARWEGFRESVALWKAVWNSSVPRIAMENPVPHRYAVAEIGLYSQTVQPYQFGHPETKRTCFWLKGLPPLRPTRFVQGRRPRVHHEPPSPDRWMRRSITYRGIAQAMADQWGA